MQLGVNAELQRLWLDARCASPTSTQRMDRIAAFLSVFVASFTDRKSTTFKTLFGDGTELVGILCKDYTDLLRRITQVTEDTTLETVQLNNAQLFAQALRLLIHDVGMSTSEVGRLAGAYEALGNFNVIALSLILHERILSLMRSARLEASVAAVLSRTDATVLRLVDGALACRRQELNRRCVLEAALPDRVLSVAVTAANFFETPSAAGVEAAECSSRILHQQLQHATDMNVARQALEKMEKELASSQRYGSSTTAAEESLQAFTCLLENILFVKQLIGFSPVETLNFDVVTATVLSCEKETGDVALPTCRRVAGCLRVLALADRRDPSTRKVSSPTVSLGSSLLRMLPASVGKVQKRLAETWSGGERRQSSRTIYCDGAVDSLARLFVLSTNPALAALYGEQLFQLLSSKVFSAPLLRYVLLICASNVATFEPPKLRYLMDFVGTLPCQSEMGDFLQAVLQLLAEGKFTQPEQRLIVVEFFVDWCPKAASHTAMALALGVIPACVQCMASLAHDPKTTELETLAERFSVLSKVVVSSKDAAQQLAGDQCSQALLEVMLTSLEADEVHTAVLLRDAFVAIVLKTGLFCDVLLKQLAAATNDGKWAPAATPLLSTLVVLLHSCGRQNRTSLPHNSIELCLSLTLEIDSGSSHPAVDRHLVNCCLCLLLALVNYSNVWSLVDQTLGRMPTTCSGFQSLLDLCTGVLRGSESLTIAESYFTDPAEPMTLRSGPQFIRIGVLTLLTEPYCEMTYPVKLLVRMADTLLTEQHADAVSAVSALEYLLLHSGVIVPNEFVVDFIVKWGRYKWLRCVANVSDAKLLPLFFSSADSLGAIDQCQRLWLAALESAEDTRDGSPYGDFVHLGDGGGASGSLNSGGDVWPPMDAYTAAMWVYIDPLTLSGRKERKVLLWQVSWEAAGRRFALSLAAHTQRQCCLYSCDFGGDVTTVELPMLPEEQWVHVLLTHSRGKVFSSQVRLYVDGVEATRCGCPYPVSGLQTAAAMAGPLPSLITREVTVTIGAARDTPGNNATLRVISFDLATSGASAKQVLSMFAMGPYQSSLVWDGAGRNVCDLRVPSLSDEAVRGIAANVQSASLDGVVRDQCVELVTPPTQMLLSVHVSAMEQISTSFGYLDNKQWVMRNTASSSDSTLILYGCYRPPRGTHTNNIDALLCNGAFYEWLRWMQRVAEESRTPPEAVVGEEDRAAESSFISTIATDVRVVAYNLLCIFSLSHKQTDLLPQSWRRFTAQFAEHLIHEPQLYLHDPAAVSLLMGVCVKYLRREGRQEQPQLPQPQLQKRRLVTESALLANLFVLEPIFFNWKLLCNLPESCWTAVLTSMRQLVAPTNPLAPLNTSRLLIADFVNGFVFGLLREYVALPRLVAAVELIKAVLLTGQSTEELMERLLTVCLLTVPSPSQAEGECSIEGTLGSALPRTAFTYVVLVRNMLLRCLNEVLESTLSDGNNTFLAAFVATMPDWGFAAMVSGRSHPVSATLSLRLFVLCFLNSKQFREGCTEAKAASIAQAMEPHCYQRELMDIVVHGYMGHLWAMASSHARYNTVAWSGKTDMEGLLVLTLHLLRAQCRLLLLRGATVSAEEGTVRHYFSVTAAEAGFAAEPRTTTARQRWRRVGCVLLAVHRLRARGTAGLGKSKEAAGEYVASPAPQYEPATDALKTLICEVLDWLTQSYQLSTALRHSLYRSSNASNLVDLLMWPVLLALRTKESVSLTATVAADPLNPARRMERVSSSESEHGSGDDDEWEVLPDPATFETRSFGMDSIGPAEGMEAVHDACKLFFLTHAASRAPNVDILAIARGQTKMSKYVLSLHRILTAEVRGVGSHTEDTRQAFLCAVWLKASAQCVDHAAAGNSGPARRNALELGKYALDRLVSGGAVPPSGLANFYRFLLARVEKDAEVLKQSRTALFEWAMYVTSASFYRLEVVLLGVVVEFAYDSMDTLFAVSMPTADLLRIVIGRALQMTVCMWSGISDDKHPSLRRMAELWKAVITANRASAALHSLFICGAPPLDLFYDGFDQLLAPTPSLEEFAAWLRQHRQEVAQLLQSYSGCPSYVFAMANGAEYLRLMTRSTSAAVGEWGRRRRHAATFATAHRQRWLDQLSTTTFVDRALLSSAAVRYPNCYVLNGAAAAPADVDVVNEWCLNDSGTVGRCRRYASERVEEVSSEPLRFFLRYAPPVCLPLSRKVSTASMGLLRPNAQAVVAKIAGRGAGESLLFAGNAYFIVGTDSYICTALLTQRELIIVTCSAVTPAGDFFVEQVRVHATTEKARTKSTLLQQAYRLFMSGKGSGNNTSSHAAFRYSQYYRQLQTEAAKGSTALVWRFPLGIITSVHQRLFQHLSAGLEVVMESGKCVFLVLLDEELSFSKAVRDRLYEHFVSESNPIMADISAHSISEKQWGLAVWTRRWVRRECSNYMYLRILNDTASRSVANLGQYPVMPWTLSNYGAAVLDLEDAGAYRDLSKPVGALNESKACQLQERYSEWIASDVSTDPPYHYGTHYSTAAIVLYFLIRLQPFTARSVRFQGGRLDIADRLFHSVGEAWANSSGRSSGDVKELIPEFFRVPSFLQNLNHVPLGTRNDGSTLDDVILPPWCGGSAVAFIYMNSLSLESEEVSAQLHRWIDLIFGYKQSGPAAVEAINVFNPLSYKEGVDRAINNAATEEERRSIVASADNFGQTPLQLFTRDSHPPRHKAAQSHTRQMEMLERVTDVSVRPCVSATVAVRHGAQIVSGVFCEDTLILHDHLSAIACAHPPQLLSYHPDMDRVVCTALRGDRVLATIGHVRSAGCGQVRCLCASPRGSVVCVGTESGKVMVYSRETSRHRFFIVAVLDSTTDPQLAGAGAVYSLYLFDEGNLVVAYAGDSALSAWHLSFLSTTFTFAATLASEADRGPVRAVSQDLHTNLYYVAKADSIVVMAPNGVLMARHSAESLLLSAAPECSARIAGSCITALLFANCASFSFSNLLLLAHSDGTLSIWCVVATRAMRGDPAVARTPLWSFQFLHNVIFEAPITCLLPSAEERMFIVGLANNTAKSLCFPSTEVDST